MVVSRRTQAMTTAPSRMLTHEVSAVETALSAIATTIVKVSRHVMYGYAYVQASRKSS